MTRVPLRSAYSLAGSDHPAGSPDLLPRHRGYGYQRRPVRLVDAPPALQALFRNQEAEVGWQGLARLHEGVLMPGGALIACTGEVVSDSLVKAGDTAKAAALQAEFQRHGTRHPTPRLDAAVVLTQGGAGNYGHWLADALPRLRDLRDSPAAGLPVLVHPQNLDLARHTAHLLSGPVPEFRAWPGQPVRIGELWFPARINTGPFNHCLESLGWLRQAAWRAHPAEVTGRRLYVSRDDSATRQLLNDDEVWPLLQARGFERLSCSRLDFGQQVRRFAEADCVVGIAGAALANLLFARPATRVLMLTPDSAPFLYYRDIVQMLDHPATWLFGPASDRTLRHHSHFRVNPDQVAAWLAGAVPG